MPAGKINVYFCTKCLRPNITRDKDDGTTPMFTICFEDNCDGQATSSMYEVNQSLHPSHEWYSPDAAERDDIRNPATLDHVRQGGLLLREIRPLPIDSRLEDLKTRTIDLLDDVVGMDRQELVDHYAASMLSWGNAVDQLTMLRARFRLARKAVREAQDGFSVNFHHPAEMTEEEESDSILHGSTALDGAQALLSGGDIDTKDAALWVRTDGVWCHRFTIHSVEGEGEGNSPFDVAEQMKAATDQPPQADLEVLPIGEVPQ